MLLIYPVDYKGIITYNAAHILFIDTLSPGKMVLYCTRDLPLQYFALTFEKCDLNLSGLWTSGVTQQRVGDGWEPVNLYGSERFIWDFRDKENCTCQQGATDADRVHYRYDAETSELLVIIDNEFAALQSGGLSKRYKVELNTYNDVWLYIPAEHDPDDDPNDLPPEFPYRIKIHRVTE